MPVSLAVAVEAPRALDTPYMVAACNGEDMVGPDDGMLKPCLRNWGS